MARVAQAGSGVELTCDRCGSIVLVLVFLLVCIRFLLRRLKNESIYPDDWLMIVAFLFVGGFTSTFPVLRQPEQRYVKFTCLGIVMTWSTVMVMWMLQCRPFNLNWKVTVPPQQCAAIIVTNVVLICIPLPMIWRTQMATVTKFKVSGVFLVGIFLVVISILRTILQESGIQATDDRYFWGAMEALLMALFANAPVLNALYRRIKRGAGSNHLASRSDIRSAMNSDGMELCSADDSREIDFMEALRVGPEHEPESMKQSGRASASPTPPIPARLAPSPSHLNKRKVVPNTNMLLSVSRSRGALSAVGVCI
ncbi:predicted protein [Sclerotinia sclerotiorum 1980 UF-70]|uniref:Rhodopsin domain-containing protein n=1 Tax=Sclerotinia sclerotiorum (strain ATCC 18683 / 1980 / Ss-1) TaxID=665079 RepID=A7EUE1_SCLS1|nr:predicted protein [Sclerotinia sclerotiorum 1980 UF-70]EDN93083.1 predicted protein [Sclerotinia sclerotiorum 1980 UF-70]